MGRFVWTVIGVALVATGCSGESSPSTPSPSSSRIGLPAADPTAAERAQDGLVTGTDLGAPWEEFEAGSGVLIDVRPTGRIGCSLEPSGEIDPAGIEAAVDGAIYQRGDATRYVTSFVLSFPDEAGARAAVEAFSGAAWRTCWARSKTETAKAQPGGEEHGWRADPVEEPAGEGEPFEGIVRFHFTAVVDGERVDANGYESVLLYRVGSMVLVTAVEGVAQKSDPRKIDRLIDDELHAATTKALERLEA